jgi:hypothetical protein
MLRYSTLVLFSLLLTQSALGQTIIDAGAAVGQQSYESSADDPRTLTSLEVLGRRGPIGLQLAVEYADLTEEGALFVVHPDVVYRWSLPANFALMVGAGPTWSYPGGSGGGLTWNAEAEIEKRWGRFALFARARQYDYGLPRFREGEAGPNGPAIYAGFRVNVVSSPTPR